MDYFYLKVSKLSKFSKGWENIYIFFRSFVRFAEQFFTFKKSTPIRFWD